MAVAILSWLLGLHFVARFIERHAVRFPLGEIGPEFRFIQWGWCSDVAFVRVRLPSWHLAFDYPRHRYALGQLVVAWSSLAGFFHYYTFD